ncbi:MAG: hypothetical protein M3P49_12550, partial [Actinomycetota bacterium]|nr:hypothetical protein [Actinomycetota bacterium]
TGPRHDRSRLAVAIAVARVIVAVVGGVVPTFDVMQSTAAVNGTLQLRSSGTTRGKAHRDALLRRSVVWLERGYLA